MAAHDDRLNDPGGPDRGRKLTQRLGIKELSWLVRVDGDLIDGDLADCFFGPRRRGQEGAKAASKAGFIHVGSPRESSRDMRSRRWISDRAASPACRGSGPR